MAVARGLAGLALAGPVFMVIFGTAHAQIMKFLHLRSCTEQLLISCSYHAMATASASTTDPMAQDDQISPKRHIISSEL